MWFSSRIRWAEAQAGTNVAFKYARVMKKGTKEIRVGGGLQWTVEERLDEYLHFVAQKVDSASNSVYLRETPGRGPRLQGRIRC